MFFGDRNDKNSNPNRRGRTLRIETLEERQLLSANGFRPSPPSAPFNESRGVVESRDLSASLDDIVVVSLPSDESADNALDSAALAEVDAVWKALGSADQDSLNGNASVAKLARDEAPDAVIANLNLADAETNGGDSSDNADNGGYRSGEGSGGTSSGDHTIHTNVFASGGFDRNIKVGELFLVKEGSSVNIDLSGGIAGEIVHYDIFCGTSNPYDFGNSSMSGDVAINSSLTGSVNVSIASDSTLENDETFWVRLSVAPNASPLDRYCFDFIIVAQTDFISDPDRFDTVSGPADSYLAYVKRDWVVGNAIVQRGSVSLEVNNPNFRYAIQLNDRNFFEINANTGIITLNRNVTEHTIPLQNSNLSNDYYRFQITIGVYDNRTLNASGEISYYLDLATVTIDISHWYIARNRSHFITRFNTIRIQASTVNAL